MPEIAATDRMAKLSEKLARLSKETVYPGLRPFQSSEDHLFFGRETQSRGIARRLDEQSFVAVLGGSGSGKSSIVRAGVEPLLRREGIARAGDSWRVVTFTPGRKPFSSLVQGLSEIVNHGEIDQSEIALTVRDFASLDGFRHRFKDRFLLAQGRQDTKPTKEQNDRANLLIVVDQFEEIFRSDADEAEAAELVGLILEAHRNRADYPKLFVVLTMRSDDLHKCARYLELPETINASFYLVRRLSREELALAVFRPAQMVMLRDELIEPGLRATERFAPFDRALVDLLIEATVRVANDPDHLPLLQHLVSAVWRHASIRWKKAAVVAEAEGGELALQRLQVTKADLAKCCGDGTSMKIDSGTISTLLGRALALCADERLGQIDQSGRALVRAALTYLAYFDEDDLIKRRFASLSDLAAVTAADPERIETALAEFERPWPFIRKLQHVGGEAYDVSHESFIRNWPKLRTWLSEEREAFNAFDRVTEAVGSSPYRSPFAFLKGWLVAPDLSSRQAQRSSRFDEKRYDFRWIRTRNGKVEREQFDHTKHQLRLAKKWPKRANIRNVGLLLIFGAFAFPLVNYLQAQAREEHFKKISESLLDMATWQNIAISNFEDTSDLPFPRQFAVLTEVADLLREIDEKVLETKVLNDSLADLKDDEASKSTKRVELQLRLLEKVADRTARRVLGSLAYISNADTGATVSPRTSAHVSRAIPVADHVRECLKVARPGDPLEVVDAARLPDEKNAYIALLKNSQQNYAEVMVVQDVDGRPGCKRVGPSAPSRVQMSNVDHSRLYQNGKMVIEPIQAGAETPFDGLRVTRLRTFGTCQEKPPCGPEELHWNVQTSTAARIPLGSETLKELPALAPEDPGREDYLEKFADAIVNADQVVLADDNAGLEYISGSESQKLREQMGAWKRDSGAEVIDDRLLEADGVLVSGASIAPGLRLADYDRMKRSSAPEQGITVGDFLTYVVSGRNNSGITDHVADDESDENEECKAVALCDHFVRVVRLENRDAGSESLLTGSQLDILDFRFVGPPIDRVRFGRGEYAGYLFFDFPDTGRVGKLMWDSDAMRREVCATLDRLKTDHVHRADTAAIPQEVYSPFYRIARPIATDSAQEVCTVQSL